MDVQLIEFMGSDLMVANAARRSFGAGYTEWSEEPRTARGRSDRQLVLDLAADGHMLPFRHPHITISCDAPIPIARQLGKHQVGFEWSEISRRYKTKDILYYKFGTKWRADLADRRQGSGELLPPDKQAFLKGIEDDAIRHCTALYIEALYHGASPEQARFLLPQSMLVHWTWTGSLLAWAHLYKQRTHKDTQQETREFAEKVGVIVSQHFPVSWEALTKGHTND